MLTFFYYIYYRACKLYEQSSSKDYEIPAIYITVITFGTNIRFILASIYRYKGLTLSYNVLFGFIAVEVVLGIVLSTFQGKQKYIELVQKYQYENHSRLKGWLTFAYIIISVVLAWSQTSVFV